MPIDETIKQLESLIINKIPLSPAGWLDIIGRIVVEMGDETDKLYALQKDIAIAKISFIKGGNSVAEAKSAVEATDAYEAMMRQKAKCLRIEELVRIGKLQSKLKETDWGAGNL